MSFWELFSKFSKYILCDLVVTERNIWPSQKLRPVDTYVLILTFRLRFSLSSNTISVFNQAQHLTKSNVAPMVHMCVWSLWFILSLSTNLRLYTVACIEGIFVNSLVAPRLFPLYCIRGNLVINQVAPSSPERICIRLVCFLSILRRIYTAYTHEKNSSLPFFKSTTLVVFKSIKTPSNPCLFLI